MEEKLVPELELKFHDAQSIEQAYMPFIKGGAFFVHTKADIKLGAEVIINLRFPDEPEAFPLSGKVVWVTPLGAQGGKKAGIGVQFHGELAESVRKKVNTLTAGLNMASTKSETM